MASDNFVNYRLARTSPKLSGNLKIDLVLRKNSISGIYLRPLSERVPYSIDPDSMPWKKSHSYNLREFYKKTKGYFYMSPIRPELESDWPIISNPANTQELKYLKDWDDTYWAGTSRMSNKIYGTTHECLIPLWLENIDDVLRLELVIKNNNNIILQLPLSIGPSGITKYLTDYFSEAQLNKGNNKLLYLNKNDLSTTLRGISVSSGKLITRKSNIILKSLIYRERPLIESDSLLCSCFQDFEMIVPQLLNLNLCFNLDEILPSFLNSDNLNSFEIYVSAYIGNTELELRDLYTNSEYVPRKQINQNSYGPSDEPLNTLQYMIDNQITEFINKNKIVQPICHWQYIEDPEKLFNIYGGFGPYSVREDGSVITYRGYNNTIIDTDRDTYDPESGDTGLFVAMTGTEADVQSALYNPQKYIDSGFYVDLKKQIGDIEFSVSSTSSFVPEHIWCGAMVSPGEIDGSKIIGPMQTTITSPNFVGILTARYNKAGENDLSDELKYASDTDKKYNIFRYSDIDNRYGSPNIAEIARHTPNKYALYVCANRSGNDIYIVLWTHFIELSDSNSRDIVYHSYLPDALTLNGLNNAISGYKDAVAQIKNYNIDTAEGQASTKKTILDTLGVVGGVFYVLDSIAQTFSIPNNIFITNTLSLRPDRSLNNNQKEAIYYKYNNKIGTLLYRDLGYIRPAMYSYPGSRDSSGNFNWQTGYGRNWFYRKRIILPEIPSSTGEYFDNETFLRFYSESIPPKSPSQEYTGILHTNYVSSGDIKSNPDGDLLIDEAWPRLLGYWPGSELTEKGKLGEWEEYKWFDKSVVKLLPSSWTGSFSLARDTGGDDYISKVEFNTAFHNVLYNSNGNTRTQLFDSAPLLASIDPYYIEQVYEFRFELSSYNGSNFIYSVSATLS